ncbi:MAG TPA: PEP-CTERM system histidine kinase PrsK, partial [Rhodoferax sp.]|nr:PEP-CTERM system histidine kinase PrsK [Rhodoferax sp.]
MGIAAWGQALVGLAYSLFALKLLQQNWGRSIPLPANRVVSATVAVSALWGWAGLAYSFGGNAHWLLLSEVMDTLRYAGWFTFLLMLLQLGASVNVAGTLKPMGVSAAVLTLLGIGLHFL